MKVGRYISSIAAAMVLASCGAVEAPDPSGFYVGPLVMNDVDVSPETLFFRFSADLKLGDKVAGESKFVYGDNEDFLNPQEFVLTDDSFSTEVLLTDFGMTYYVKAVFTSGAKSIESEPVSFTILPFENYIFFKRLEALSVNENSVVFHVKFLYANGITPEKIGAEIASAIDPVLSFDMQAAEAMGGDAEVEITSLEPGTSYYARPFLMAGGIVVFGEWIRFTTK